MRAIQQAIENLMQLAELVRAGREQEALEVCDGARRELLGLGSSATAGMSDAALMALLEERGGGVELRTRALLLAALLREESELHSRAGRRSEGLRRLLTSLQIALQIPDPQRPWPSWAPQIQALAGALREAGVVLPARTSLALAMYQARQGDFAAAEDATFRALETPGAEPAHLEQARALYGWMLQQSDDALRTGGLPRDEVLASLEEIDAMAGA